MDLRVTSNIESSSSAANTPREGDSDATEVFASLLNPVSAPAAGLTGVEEASKVAPSADVNDPETLLAVATTSRLPVPQAYVVAASFALTPEALVNLPDSGLPTGTRIVVAGLANADAVNQGNFGDAFLGTTLFISISIPGQPTATVATWNPRSGSVEIGQGIARPFNLGVVNGAFFGNYRGNPLAVTPGSDLDAVGSANLGVLIGSPALSRALSGALANAIRGGGRALAVALAGSGIGAAGTLPAAFVTELLARVANTGNYFIGAAYHGAISTDGTSVTVQGPAGNINFSIDDFIKTAMGEFTYDNRNFGITEIAFAKNQWQLANGSSYFQLSAASGGWSFINNTAGEVLEAVPRRNHGDPGLALINYLNIWGQATAQPAGPNATSPLTYRDITPPTDANGLPSRYYVRMFQNIGSGQQAVEVVQYLKQTLSDANWQEFLSGLRPLAEPLGLNLGLTELNPVAPATQDLQQAREYLDRDWNKNSNPRETRGIQEIPREIYDQIRSDLGLDLVAGDGTFVYPDYISPDLPTGDPEAAEIYPEGYETTPTALLTPEDLDPTVPALTPDDGVIYEAGIGGEYTATERNDVLYGGDGVDILNGGEGDDLLVGTGLEDTLNGGPGNDVATFLRAPRGITLDLGSAANLIDIEAIGGSDYADTITADAANPTTIYGFGGNDVITGANGSIIYGDYSPDFVSRFGQVLRLDPTRLPQGNNRIDMSGVTIGEVYAGAGNDSVRIEATANLDDDGNVTGLNISPDLILDGQEGVDLLTIRITNPITKPPLLTLADLPPNIRNFERLRFEYEGAPLYIGVPGISSEPVAHNAPTGWTNTGGTPDVVAGNGPWPGSSDIEVADISGPSPFGGTMAHLVSTTDGWEESIDTQITGLTPGQAYTVQFAWQQSTVLNDPAGTLSGGQLRVTIGDQVQVLEPTGTAASDDWKIEDITFIAASETVNVQISSVAGRNGAIVVDTFGPTLRLANTISYLPEDTNTDARLKVADIIADGDVSDLELSLAGQDANLFEIDGNELFLRAGAHLDFEKQTFLDVSVLGDNLGTANNPDTQVGFILNITDVDDTAMVTLENVVNNLVENLDTSERIRVADLVFSNAEPGNYTVTLTGPDAEKFEIIGDQLFLKAGVPLDYETQTGLSIGIQVDDLSTERPVDGFQSYYLNVENVVGPDDPNDIPIPIYG